MRLTTWTVVLAGWLGVAAGWGQVTGTPATTPAPIAVGGVMLTPDGMLQMRRVMPGVAAKRSGGAGLTYVSLPRAFGELRAASERGESIPAELRYLRGLTRIEYVFVFPEEHDLVIAGPSEPLSVQNPLEPVGMISGRPAVQLEDLIVALRAVEARGGLGNSGPRADMFGCSLDMVPDAQAIANDVGRRLANASRAQISEELKNALGPQRVRIIGVPGDTRVALAMVCADYRLKRMCIGLDPAILGNALGGGLASNRLWFEPAYEPLGVSADGLNYRIAGPRLKVEAGPQEFVKKGATAAATAFAARFSEKVPEVAARIEAIADLQNIADEFVVAALIREDRLAEKAGVDLTWVMSAACKVAAYPAPRTAETLVSDTGSLIAQGGVQLEARALADLARGGDERGMAQAARARPASEWWLTKGKGL